MTIVGHRMQHNQQDKGMVQVPPGLPPAGNIKRRPSVTGSDAPVGHLRGTPYPCDHHEAADMAATLDEARRQVDALLGPEVTHG